MVTLAMLFAKDARGQTVLTNGASANGSILTGTTNSYTFTAAIGDNLVLRAGELTATGYFSPWLRVYRPDGMLVGSAGIREALRFRRSR